MTRSSLLAALAAALSPVPAAAQSMPGMAMPGDQPAPASAPSQDHPGAGRGPAAHPSRLATDASQLDPGLRRGGDAMAMPGMAMTPATAEMPAMGMGGTAWSIGSGTARLPAAEGPMRGAMLHAGGWMVMAHGYAWATYTDQGGPRGDRQGFVTSMAMLMGDRDLGPRWHLQLKGMASADPSLGPTGYPDLFASGEVAHGRPLIDRQHPHDLFMELAARADYRMGDASDGRSVFLYGGPVAEPALGPSAFMHRGSTRYLPLAPISHHWFDSTHISYGVVTGGWSSPRLQVEASGFRGREPDQHRWDIETPALDSWSVRATWTANAHVAVQVSHGFLRSPEQQEPGEDERRTTASVQYATGGLTTTFAWSLKDKGASRRFPALLAEASWEIGRHHAVFGRVERVANDELFPNPVDPLHDRRFRVVKAEGGYAYRLPIAGPFGVALGGTLAAYAKPAVLDAVYGRAPVSWTLFSKFVLGL